MMSRRRLAAGRPSVFIVNFLVIMGTLVETAASEHRTKAASEKLTDLWCYKCDTMTDERCQHLQDNATILQTKCNNEHRICKVKRISMSTSTEDVTGRPKLWLLQRNCTKSCEPGCIVVGERTKLYSCTTCCETSLCNYGSGSMRHPAPIDVRLLSLLVLVESIASSSTIRLL